MSSKAKLAGQTVLVLGGSSGIGLEPARLAHEEGADLILSARDPDRLHRVGLELGASISAFDLNQPDRLAQFFANLAGPVDHVLVSGVGPATRPSPGSTPARSVEASIGSCCPSRSRAWRRTRCNPPEACC